MDGPRLILRSDENSTATLNHTDVRSSENSTSFGFALGTEENSISIESKSKSEITEVASLDDRTTVNVSDESRELYTKTNYSNTSKTDSSFKFSLGTDDGFEFENESSFYTNISYAEDGGQTSDNLTAGYLTENYYVDYSEGFELEDASQPLPERANLERLTAYHPNPDFSWVDEYVNNAPPNPFAGEENKTPQQILADYRAHKEQQFRLEALLAITDDPEMQQLLRDQIAMQESILAEITSAAGDAEITSEELTTADQEAQDADPPEALDEWDGGTSYLGLVDLGQMLPVPPDFTFTAGYGGDVHIYFWHWAADIEFNFGWDESDGNVSGGPAFSVGKGHGFGLEAGLGFFGEITGQDHIDDLRGFGRQYGVNTMLAGCGGMSTSPFKNAGNKGMWMSQPTLGFSVFDMETYSEGYTWNINFEF